MLDVVLPDILISSLHYMIIKKLLVEGSDHLFIFLFHRFLLIPTGQSGATNSTPGSKCQNL